ncbi:hypothetical protein OsJ_30342 [Oryza sativa Japonica Group]|uniref:DUF1618 domain-containing protein n=1 Tax=Oryza sativa subsp. japonica TaxID=39947 RepID=B9G530_ORYSJ|nr:hypothetical protein OsJ_30342 [Oryza sativa Japonica Group]
MDVNMVLFDDDDDYWDKEEEEDDERVEVPKSGGVYGYDVPFPNMDFLDDPEENDLYLFKVSLCPPSHPPPPADPGCCSWVLLDRTAYVADHANATTANTFFTTRDRRRREIRVTFFPAPPPRVSHFCVHCPSMKPECFAVGITHCDGGGHEHYIIAALMFDSSRKMYDLHRFHSKNGSWSTKALHLGTMEPSPGLTFFFHDTYKVITLGGGFMAWVDLRRGILLCDVLLDDPEPHFIPLPPPLKADKELIGDAREFRDIAVVHGYIKYVEIQSYISDGWVAATWSRKITLEDSWEGDWRKDCELHVSDISGSLPELLGDEEARTAQLNLQSLHTGNPTISLQDDDVVYFLAKVGLRDDKSYVLAVNMRSKTLQGAACFGAERVLDMNFTCTQSRISHYLRNTPVSVEYRG